MKQRGNLGGGGLGPYLKIKQKRNIKNILFSSRHIV